jgi:serine/threonine protein kinase
MSPSSPVEEIFFAVLDQPPAERAAYLAAACGEDAQLRRRVERLLSAHPEVGSFLESPAAASPLPPGGRGDGGEGGAATATLEPLDAHPGTLIASKYKLLEEIGEGGMGTVWMAEQLEPVRRKVALKLIRPGMDSSQVIARFEAERQALALMDHPNIAKVLDAGTVGQDSNPAASSDRIGILSHIGRPFFVMELVKGVPITKYCDEHRLTPRQRLELFVPVCQAVQHAHQKGIIHRDLKPSNVLVALYDGKPVPKVIDFGVAKAAGQSLTDKTLVTGFGAIVGTLEYMSPEQAEVNQLDIDTRSDIYSLGVLLYELLTGSPPFSRKELEKAGMLEMLRVIREQEPSKPSTKLSSSDALPTLAANRGTEPVKLTKLVRGELDWIVMRALEKDRNRRYETANGFAADVQRYLADEPVQACPPSAGYRLRKFARKYRAVLSTAGVVAFLLVAGLGVSLWQMNRAIDAEGQARQERDAKVEALKAETAERKRAEKAEADAKAGSDSVRHAHQRAERNFKKSRALTDRILSDLGEQLTHEPQLRPVRKQAYETAVAYYKDFLEESDDPEVRREAAQAYRRLGTVNREMRLFDEAEKNYRAGAVLCRELVAQRPEVADYQYGLANLSNNLAAAMELQERWQEAAETYRATLTVYERLTAAHPNNAVYLSGVGRNSNNYAGNLMRMDRPAEADPYYRQSVAAYEKLAREFPPNMRYPWERTGALLSWSHCLRDLDRHEEAERRMREAKQLAEDLVRSWPSWPSYQRDVARIDLALSRLLADTGRAEEAEKLVREALTITDKLCAATRVLPADRQVHGSALSHLGYALDRLDRAGEAEECHRKALTVVERLAADNPDVPEYGKQLAASHSELGVFLRNTERLPQAAERFREATKLDPKNPEPLDRLAELLANSPDPKLRDGAARQEGRRSSAAVGRLPANAR